MNPIDKITANKKAAVNSIPIVPSSGNVMKESNRQDRRDSVTVSHSQTPTVTPHTYMEDELAALLKNFPEIEVLLTNDLDIRQLPKLAEQLGYGQHLLLSQKWLDQIMSSEEQFQKGKELLERILTQLTSGSKLSPASGAYIGTDGITFWTGTEKQAIPQEDNKLSDYSSFLEQLKKSKENQASNSFDRQFKHKVSNYAVAGIYSRLAGAHSKVQVRAAVSEVHRSIGTLQITSVLGESEERMKARAAISSLRKLLIRGSRKIQRLSSEELVQLREKRARKQEAHKKALALKLELVRQRNKRKIADGATALEGHLDDVNNAYRFHNQREDEHRYGSYAEYISAPVASVPTLPSIADAGGTIAGNAGVSLDIQLSPVIPMSDI